MEIPTTNDVLLLREFQEVFNEDIRPVAENEFKIMGKEYTKEFARYRDKLLPVSIVMDTMLYMTRNLAQTACDEMRDAYNTGDVDKLQESCSNFDPYWKSAKSLSMAIRVFAQDETKGADYIPDEGSDCVCYVCGHESDQPMTQAERKACRGGCPECEETLEAVFP